MRACACGWVATAGQPHPACAPANRLRAGWLVGLSWRSFETWGQVSLRNRLMVQGDWIKVRVKWSERTGSGSLGGEG